MIHHTSITAHDENEDEIKRYTNKHSTSLGIMILLLTNTSVCIYILYNLSVKV